MRILLIFGGVALAWLFFRKNTAPPPAPVSTPSPARPNPNKQSLAILRSAITIYSGDHGGSFPDSLDALVQGGKYLGKIPDVQETAHLRTDEVESYPSRQPRDTGRWGYIGNRADREWGGVFIDCTHTDWNGTAWATY